MTKTVSLPVTRALAFLEKNPLDYRGCAKLLGMTWKEFSQLKAENETEFQLKEDEYYCLLQALCAKVALGQDLPDEYLLFDFAKALKILERRTLAWAPSKKAERKEGPKPNGTWKEIVGTTNDQTKHTSEDEPPEGLRLSRTLQ